MSLKKILYNAKAHAMRGHEGASCTNNCPLDVKVSSSGTAGNGTNLEQLFTMGWSTCFVGAMKVAAGKMMIALPPDAVFNGWVEAKAKSRGISMTLGLGASTSAEPRMERDHQNRE